MDGDNTRAAALVTAEWAEDRDQVKKHMDSYMSNFEGDDASVDTRKGNYTTLVNQFYDLVTDFYEYGWGHSFHFAARHKGETFDASLARHEMWLAKEIRLRPGMTCVDLGCGVGGPARCIARFSQANVIGVNNNAYQISRGTKFSEEEKLDHLVSFVKADFMHLPMEENSLDAAYQIEATLHAPDKVGIYSEIFRVLKPGAYFGGYEWVMKSDKYEADNARHKAIKVGIEKGNGIPDLELETDIVEAMKTAGFEIVEHFERGYDSDIPWYEPLAGSFSLSGFKHTRLGRYFTDRMVATLEYLKIAPAGSTRVSQMLCETANDLVDGGKLEIFSPCYWVLARKPE